MSVRENFDSNLSSKGVRFLSESNENLMLKKLDCNFNYTRRISQFTDKGQGRVDSF